MKILSKYLLRQVVPVFFAALSIFILILQLVDIFANIFSYLSNNVPLKEILAITFFYIPKCISYSIPLSILFAVSFVLGEMYSKNEMTAIFSSGIPLYKFIIPLLVFVFFLSVFGFFFEDRVVIRSTVIKNQRQEAALQRDEDKNNDNIIILSREGRIIYKAEKYDANQKKLSSVLVVFRDEEGNLDAVLSAESGIWDTEKWAFYNTAYYVYNPQSENFEKKDYSPDKLILDEDPSVFQKNTVNIEEMTAGDAKKVIESMKAAGLPYAEPLSNYYRRFSFSLTPLIVVFISISVSGWFRKNVMLMSLLLSLASSVLYYITEMMTMLLAKWEYITPFMGAWFPLILFTVICSLLMKVIRT